MGVRGESGAFEVDVAEILTLSTISFGNRANMLVLLVCLETYIA